MKRTKRTAAEIINEIQKDPKLLDKQSELRIKQTQQETQIKELEKPLLEELKAAGYVASSLSEIPRIYAPLPKEIVDILLRWIPLTSDTKVLEWIVRILAATKVRFNGSLLVELFENTKSENLRWVIANTMQSACPTGISEWVNRAILNPSYGKSREMLALAVARLTPKEIANETLIGIFKEYPGHAAEGLSKTGGEKELQFLKDHQNNYTGWVKKSIEKAIKSISNRL